MPAASVSSPSETSILMSILPQAASPHDPLTRVPAARERRQIRRHSRSRARSAAPTMHGPRPVRHRTAPPPRRRRWRRSRSPPGARIVVILTIGTGLGGGSCLMGGCCVAGLARRGDRARQYRAPRAAVRVRPRGVLGAVRERAGAGSRGPGTRQGRTRAGQGHAPARRWRAGNDHGPRGDHAAHLSRSSEQRKPEPASTVARSASQAHPCALPECLARRALLSRRRGRAGAPARRSPPPLALSSRYRKLSTGSPDPAPGPGPRANGAVTRSGRL